ncbi:MAG TPA: hypothetical protein VKV05_14950 [Terriglobales bacterium]|nr:hypothetical protein [Terriglobales bacterium]
MAQNDNPPQSGSPVPSQPAVQTNAPTPTPAPETQPPAYEEFSSAKRNLPSIAPLTVAILLVAVVVGIVAYLERAKPVAQGSIDGVWFSQPANMPRPMILIETTVRNVGKKPLFIKEISAAVETDQGNQSDEAAAASDYGRYFLAYPDLQGHAAPLQVEMKIPPGAEQKGAVMISVPITQQQFDQRKDLTVTIQTYDSGSIVLHEKNGPGK